METTPFQSTTYIHTIMLGGGKCHHGEQTHTPSNFHCISVCVEQINTHSTSNTLNNLSICTSGTIATAITPS